MGELIKETFKGVEWVLSEGLHCLFCGHRGLWLGDNDCWGYEALEHYCATCDALYLVHPAVMDIRYTAEEQKERRELLRRREQSTPAQCAHGVGVYRVLDGITGYDCTICGVFVPKRIHTSKETP